MLKFKKIWLFLLGIMVIFWFNLQFTDWLCLQRDHCIDGVWSQKEYRPSDPSIDWEGITGDVIWSWTYAMWEKSTWILHFPHADDYDTELWYFLALIKIIINRILGIMTFIALVYMLYCGFLVISAWSNDKNVEKGKQWVKSAAIAIAWIWLAWLIISAMIRFIKVITDADGL